MTKSKQIKINKIQLNPNTVIFSKKSEKEVRHMFETRRYIPNKNVFGQADEMVAAMHVTGKSFNYAN